MRNCIDSGSQIAFGEFPCDEALGVVLAHTLKVGEHKLKKGCVLDAADIAMLKQAGIEKISGARLQADDLAENDAAAAIAALLAGAHTQPRRPYSGRCNVHATTSGVVVMDADSIIRANRIDPAITIGTLPPWSLARKGQVIATVKIIPFGVKRHVMDACHQLLAAPPLRVAELQPHRTALILTEASGIRESALAATAAATRQRLEALGSRVALELRCQHETAAIEAALRQARAAGCELILISGATGTKDRRDVAPAAIVAAGGSIERFGMPVEPGNMLLLAHLHSVPVVVLPGCARSRRLNGLDWVLRRLLAKLPLSDEEFAAMGVGGLIRHMPGEANADDAPDPDDESAAPQPLPLPTRSGTPGSPRIAALVLAAGQSRRMGDTNKLLVCVDGIPLVLRAANAALASRATSVTVVTGCAAEQVAAVLDVTRVALAHNPDHATGMASSLRRGIAALPEDADGVLVMLADMPRISAAHLDKLIEVYLANPAIVVPMCNGKRGNPVLWPRRHFAEMLAIEGDQGARTLLTLHADKIVSVEMDDQAIFLDVDTPGDLAECITGEAG